jgi:hypothetical protein
MTGDAYSEIDTVAETGSENTGSTEGISFWPFSSPKVQRFHDDFDNS